MQKMQVFIAGVNHFDPLCRVRLENWLRALLSSQSTPPSVVAVEWDEAIFNKVKSQRANVRVLATSRWPQSTVEFLNALEATVAFEADTHIPLMPGIPTVWLDQGRALPYSDAIEKYAPDRIRIYDSYIPAGTTTFDSSLLDTMSLEAWKQLDKGGASETDRDTIFADIITKHLGSEKSTWAIVIVGAKHASREIDQMAYRLEVAGDTFGNNQLRPHTKNAHPLGGVVE